MSAPASAVYELCVVVLNYRTPALVMDCLASLEPQILQTPKSCVVVVDNASGDGSAEKIATGLRQRGWGGWARLVASPDNRGFAAGNNQGIRAVRARLYLLLNSDTIVRPGTVAALCGAALTYPRAAVIGCRIEDAEGMRESSAFRFPTPLSEFVRAARTGIVTRLLARFAVVTHPIDGRDRVDWVSFAAVLLSARAFEAAWLDEGYFMYFEDVDFCQQAWRGGWEVRFEPSASVVHLEGVSSGVPTARSERRRLPRYYYESRNRYFARWFGRGIGPLAANLAWTAGWFIALLRDALRREGAGSARREPLDVWQGWLARPGPLGGGA